MPGCFYLAHAAEEIGAHLGADPAPAAILAPRLDIAPGQPIPVCRPHRRLVEMRWGLIPQGRVNARGRPAMETLVNARSETVFEKSAFAGLRRGVVPASGWYEWTGPARREIAWRIRPRDGVPLAFAATWDVWQAPGGREVAQVATLTCPASADVRDIHDRMGVILSRADIAAWLAGDLPAARPAPWPDGRLCVEAARDVDLGGSAH